MLPIRRVLCVPGLPPVCTLCPDAEPRRFKNKRSLRAHHQKYHPDAGSLVFVSVLEEPVEEPGLDVRNLQSTDFERCRVSEDGLLAVSDAIQAFQGRGCTVQRATDLWNSTLKPRMGNSATIEYRPFPRADGCLGKALACCSFQNLPTLLGLLPGTRASLLRQYMADRAARPVEPVEPPQEPVEPPQKPVEPVDLNEMADRDLGSTVPMATLAVRRENRGVEGPERAIAHSVVGAVADRGKVFSAPTPENPVRRNSLMQLTTADFQSCRTTPEGLISVTDAMRTPKRFGYDIPVGTILSPLESRWISTNSRAPGSDRLR